MREKIIRNEFTLLDEAGVQAALVGLPASVYSAPGTPPWVAELLPAHGGAAKARNQRLQAIYARANRAIAALNAAAAVAAAAASAAASPEPLADSPAPPPLRHPRVAALGATPSPAAFELPHAN